MKRLVTFFSLALSAIVVIVLCSLLAPANISATNADLDYQRYITFHNDFNFQIYPVIQVPADICDGADFTNVRRILVNGPGHTGLQPDETVTVLIPNEKQDITVDGVPLARDVVYMGLDPKDMPRVNVNLPAAPPNPPDPNAVSWPPNATITTQLQSDGTVLVS